MLIILLKFFKLNVILNLIFDIKIKLRITFNNKREPK